MTDFFHSGAAFTIWMAIAGRVVAGIGASGMVDLISVIIGGMQFILFNSIGG